MENKAGGEYVQPIERLVVTATNGCYDSRFGKGNANSSAPLGVGRI